jgi:hypothetical protein
MIATTLSLFACATHSPTRGDKMQIHSTRAEMLGEKWNEGEKLIAEGKSLRDKGSDLINKGQKQIITGNASVTEGNSNISSGAEMLEQGQEKIEQGLVLKKESEISFQKHFPNTTL